MDLEALSTKEVAYHITLFDWDLFWAVHEYELLYHTFGRHHFGKVSSKLKEEKKNNFFLIINKRFFSEHEAALCCVWRVLFFYFLHKLS